ncbi:MAG: hypothetical protein ACREKI_02870 [Gemmatimonadota bacterium]
MTDLVLHPMSFGQILDGAFALYRRHLPVMIGIVAMLYGPVMIAFVVFFGSMTMVAPEAVEPADVIALSAGFFLLYLFALLSYTAVQGALTQAVSDAFLTRHVSIGRACLAALRRLLPLVGGALLKGLLITVMSLLGLVALLPLGIAAALGVNSTVLAVAGVLVGALAVLTLMSVGWAMFFGVTPAIILERAGPAQAITRSVRLARGRWIRILLVLSVAVLIPLVLWLGGLLAATLLIPNPVVGQVVSQLIAVALMPYYVICVVLLYYDARIRSEGFDLAVLAEQLRPAAAAP